MVALAPPPPQRPQSGIGRPPTLTRAPSANPDASATLPPWNTHATTSNSTSPPQPRHGAPCPHGPHRRPRAVPPPTAGGCFSRAQKLGPTFCIWNEGASYDHPDETTSRNCTGSRSNLRPPQHPPRRRATRTCGGSGGVQERGKAQCGRENVRVTTFIVVAAKAGTSPLAANGFRRRRPAGAIREPLLPFVEGLPERFQPAPRLPRLDLPANLVANPLPDQIYRDWDSHTHRLLGGGPCQRERPPSSPSTQ